MRVVVAASGHAQRMSLAMVRSLGRGGAHVTLGSSRRRGEALHSRYCHAHMAYPRPGKDPEAFARALAEQLQAGRYDVLLPAADDVNLAISRHRDLIEPHVRMALPEAASLLAAHDKLEAIRIAAALGIAVPRTHAPADERELREIAQKLDYPCVLKPRAGTGAIGMHILHSPAALLDRYRALPATGDLVFDTRALVQEYVPGPVEDVCTLMDRGEARAVVTTRRLRMFPASGGGGIDTVTTWDPELRAQGVRMLEALGWHGPAEVEFKRDPRDGVLKFTEVNTRFWGTLAVSIAAGVDFPWLCCRLALDGEVEPAFDYRVGLRYRWLVPHSLAWARSSPRPWRALWNLARPDRNCRSDLDLRDPLPSLARGAAALGNAWRRLGRRS